MNTHMCPMAFLPVTQPEQIQTVADLAGPIWREHFTPIIGPEQVEFMLEDWQSPRAIAAQIHDGVRYFIAMHADQPAGYCAWQTENMRRAKISKFYLLRAYRGRGYAQQMMDFVENSNRAAGAKTLWLQVNRHNHQAIAFYRKVGFQVVRDQYQQVGPGFYIDDHIMEKTLTQQDDII